MDATNIVRVTETGLVAQGSLRRKNNYPEMGTFASAPAAAYTYVPPPPPKPIPYYIIQKLNQTYLTLRPDGSMGFDPLLEVAERQRQQWVFRHEKQDNRAMLVYGYNYIMPLLKQDQCIRLDDAGVTAEFCAVDAQSQRKWWYVDRVYNRVHNGSVYECSETFSNAKFQSVGLFTPFFAGADYLAPNNADEAEVLLIQESPMVKPLMLITKPVISYDFDGVLHVSVKMSYDFHNDINSATYHPLDFNSSDLVPFVHMIEQLKKEFDNGYQIIIVTARNSSSDHHIREYLRKQEILDCVSNILYISNKAPFLKAIGVVRHYDDSPKQIVEMLRLKVPVVPVTPPLNCYWLTTGPDGAPQVIDRPKPAYHYTPPTYSGAAAATTYSAPSYSTPTYSGAASGATIPASSGASAPAPTDFSTALVPVAGSIPEISYSAVPVPGGVPVPTAPIMTAIDESDMAHWAF